MGQREHRGSRYLQRVADPLAGLEIYYQGVGPLLAATFDPATGRVTSSPEQIGLSLPILGGFDVTAEGLFVLPQAPERSGDRGRLMPTLIENWPKLLQR
jgi:hypothetical protein